ncbi:MAG: hypothetical protein CSA86_05130 [Arcobacter sp.]|nr:MAG: hypothetical protein CSA86_05130 [Arcobacter sp.]
MKTIPLLNLFYLLIPLIIVGIYYYKWTDDRKDIALATFRMILQLLLIGYLLIFIFEDKHPIVGTFIILFMTMISSQITIRNVQDRSIKHYSIIFISIFISVIVHLFLIINFVLDIQNFYEPRYIIPIAGMIFASTMNALSLNIERFEKEKSKTEFFDARKISFKVAMIPQINSLLAVGVVALPGMMTGQILSGIDPLIAVRYQIMIMSMTLSTAGISIIVYFLLKGKR